MNGATENVGGVAVTVHRIHTEDQVELAVTRLDGAAAGAPVVVLVHGLFCHRSFWLSKKGGGLGPYLAERGYDVWIPELRGHGRSPKDRRFRGWTAEDQLQFDVPAVQRLVGATTGRNAHWVGHSWGGQAIMGSLGGGWLDRGSIASLVTLGANVTAGDDWMKKRLPAAAAKLVLAVTGKVPAPLLGLGPEVASRGYVMDFFRWKGRNGAWLTRDGRDYWQGVRAIDRPLLAFAAPDDKNDPAWGCEKLFDAVGSDDKRFVLLSKQNGFATEYKHVEMIISKEAQAEVWPMIDAWMKAHPTGQ